MIILAGLLVALPAAYLLSLARGEWRPVVALEDLEADGIVYRHALRVFVVEEEAGPVALAAITPGGAGQRVVYCPFARAFQAPDGSVFDRSGRAIGGPAERGLDRFPVRLRVGVVEVDIGTRVEGPPREVVTEDIRASLCAVPGAEEPLGFATVRRTP